MKPSRYRDIEVAGEPRELGRQLGEAAAEEIAEFCSVALERVNLAMRVSRQTAIEVARESLAFAERYAPDLVEELRGMAEGARVSLDDLMLLQVRNQFRPDLDAGCTSFSQGAVRQSASGLRSNAILAQNWDNDPALDPFTVVVTRRPKGKPALVNVTQAGLIAYIGFSEAGIGLCLNSLPAPARRSGVPLYFSVRKMYEAQSLDEAVAALDRAYRAIPINIMMASPEGPADLEATLDGVHVIRGADWRPIAHANHCLARDLTPINAQFPELIQSHARQRRIDELLAAIGDRPLDASDAASLLKDHQNHPRSICRHANDDPATGFWETVFSVIIEPQERRMRVSRGHPCASDYEVYELR